MRVSYLDGAFGLVVFFATVTATAAAPAPIAVYGLNRDCTAPGECIVTFNGTPSAGALITELSCAGVITSSSTSPVVIDWISVGGTVFQGGAVLWGAPEITSQQNGTTEFVYNAGSSFPLSGSKFQVSLIMTGGKAPGTGLFQCSALISDGTINAPPPKPPTPRP
jgi:hypothetical protein